MTKDFSNGASITPAPPRDLFERLVNTPGTGSIQEIATAVDDIASIHGFMVDLDPYDFREAGPLGIQAGLTPMEFYERYLQDRLQRLTFWKYAEVICSGSGLALVHRFEAPLICKNVTDVRRFDLQVKIIHTSLPSDPDQGGVCQVPRVPGSINTKRGEDRPVARLAEGTPITHQRFVEFADRMIAEPMTVILETLFGGTRLNPCPLCGREDARLTPVQKGRAAKCNKCGQYSMGKLYSLILKDREPAEPVEQFDNAETNNE